MSQGTQEQLRWEADWRGRAFIAAALGALLPMAGSIAGSVIAGDAGDDDTSRLLFFHDHATQLVASSIALALGALAIAAVLFYLFRATQSRRPELPQVALISALVGPVVLTVAQVASQIALAHKSAVFATTGNQTYEEARHIFDAGLLKALATIGLAGQLALGFAFVMIALNAMRAGLLTRFMGIMGIIVGVLFVVPIGSPLPVVQSFWLVSLAYLFSGRWPNGVPPAWATGRAEPWPSYQDQREQAAGGSGARKAPAPRAEPRTEPAAALPQGKQHPVSKKRKRKRKR